MTVDDLSFVRESAASLGLPYDLRRTIERLTEHAGYDFEASPITANDLFKVATDGGDADWFEIGFVCKEVLSLYLGKVVAPDAQEIVCWILGSFLLRDAISKGYSSWDLHIDAVLRYLVDKVTVSDKVDTIRFLRLLVT